MLVGYHARGTNEVIPVTRCPLLVPELEAFLAELPSLLTMDAPKRLDAIICDDLQKLSIEREREDERIIGWISHMDAKAFAGRFSYMTVTDMRTVSQRLAPALAHFFNHQTHHRGQAHALLSGFRLEAPVLDLIYFQRSEEGRKWA